MKTKKMADIKISISELEMKILHNPNNVKLYLKRAKLFRKLNEYFYAMADYNKVLKIDPFCVEAYYKRGVTKYIQHHYLQAIEDFDKAIEIDPNLPKLYLKKYDALYALGNINEADKISIKYYDLIGKINNYSIF